MIDIIPFLYGLACSNLPVNKEQVATITFQKLPFPHTTALNKRSYKPSYSIITCPYLLELSLERDYLIEYILACSKPKGETIKRGIELMAYNALFFPITYSRKKDTNSSILLS